MDIKSVIAQMTLEEKASLLSGLDFWHTKPVERLGIPSVMVSDGPHGLRKQDDQADHLGVNESIKAVCMPTACASAASFDRDVLRQIGEAVGDACQHERVAVNLGPAVNIKRSPLCGRNFEYFSEDPYLAAELATSIVKGIQSRNIGVSVKHFAANSQENRRMSSDSIVDERTLREIYYPAFESAVKDGRAWTVMCSYNRLNGEYASQHRRLLTDLLRGEWGFDGYVVSDWGAVSDRVKGVHAGLDLEMPASGGTNDKRVVDAVRAGQLDEKDVDLAVERILTIHQRYLDNARPDTPWDMEAQHQLSRRLAAECMVLLKNEDGVLPIRSGEKIAVIGKFAREPRFQGGGSSHINCFRIESLMDALEGTEGVAYAQGYDIVTEEPDEALIAEAVEAARKADKAVIIAGLPDAFESEGYDRTHMRMPKCQVELIRRVSQANENTIVVLYNGSPVEMPWIGCAKAVIEGYLGGQAVGGATKDVLFGDVNPCGRLPESFPHQLEDNPSYLTYGGEGDVAVYSEGVFVGYRYYDRKKMDVLFPFGYGLSYTTFAYSNLRLSAQSITDQDELTVSVDVTNTGAAAGKEVVQLYVGDRESTVFRPVRELKGFEKIFLEPGETKTVTFTLGKRAFAYWNVQLHDWHVESGEFTIEIGRSSRDIALSCEVSVSSTTEIPVRFTVDSIFDDLMKSPKAMAKLAPLIDSVKRSMGFGGESEAASAAISNEMMEAMIRYMPLRTVGSFSGGAMSYDQLSALVDAINEA
ncbi:MAG: glycoside hydrolase family 3 C-terminal domain-containing protein [Clostridia bacterium]|nr:glycoside hydrolase family 3 C-terminal domain-containing protein [Clostridia bacterium]